MAGKKFGAGKKERKKEERRHEKSLWQEIKEWQERKKEREEKRREEKERQEPLKKTSKPAENPARNKKDMIIAFLFRCYKSARVRHTEYAARAHF